MHCRLDDLSAAVGYCDPASGKAKTVRRVAARSAIVVIATDALTRVFVLYAWAGRVSTKALGEQLAEVYETWKPKLFGIESNGMQTAFGDALRLYLRERGLRVPLMPHHQPTKIDKDFRIRAALSPVVNNGRLFLQHSQVELQQELTNFPMTATKDLIDALASAVTLLPGRPAPVVRADEAAARLAYLRDSGAPASYIQAVAEGRA